MSRPPNRIPRAVFSAKYHRCGKIMKSPKIKNIHIRSAMTSEREREENKQPASLRYAMAPTSSFPVAVSPGAESADDTTEIGCDRCYCFVIAGVGVAVLVVSVSCSSSSGGDGGRLVVVGVERVAVVVVLLLLVVVVVMVVVL